MTIIRSFLAAAFGLAISSSAWAIPVTTYHTTLFDSSGNPVPGTITATFDLYTRPYGPSTPGGTAYSPRGPVVLVDQFSLGLGSDFLVHIPRAVVDTHAAWDVSIPTGTFGSPGWPWPGLNQLVQSFPGGTDVASLSDWCALPGHAFVDGIFVPALRGTCTFADKVANIQTRNGVGAIIVNNNPLAGAMAMSLGTFNPGIPVLSLSYERGQQLMAELISTGADGITDLVYLDFAARWDPDPVVDPVPAPASLGLLVAGLAALAGLRTRRHKSPAPRER